MTPATQKLSYLRKLILGETAVKYNLMFEGRAWVNLWPRKELKSSGSERTPNPVTLMFRVIHIKGI